MSPCYPVTEGLIGALRVGGPVLFGAIMLVGLFGFCVGVLMGRNP